MKNLGFEGERLAPASSIFERHGADQHRRTVAVQRAARGPIVLTVSGLIGAGNRGPLDPALDQMMAKQKISFEKAQVFDFAALAALPAVRIQPTLEYDGKPHSLKGPLLLDVLAACGVQMSDKTMFFSRAVDGYAVQVTGAELIRYRFIVVTHIDVNAA